MGTRGRELLDYVAMLAVWKCIQMKVECRPTFILSGMIFGTASNCDDQSAYHAGSILMFSPM